VADTSAQDEPVVDATGSSADGAPTPAGAAGGPAAAPAAAAPAAAAPAAAASSGAAAAGEAGRHPGGRLWLIRHGETEWSKARLHTGKTDMPLTGYGERQAAALGEVLGRLRPALVLCSPRQRARRTAELAGLRDIVICPDLAEWDYGGYEGLTTPQIRERRPGWTIWTGDPPGGETAQQVGARADRVLAHLRPSLAAGDVVVVSHGHLGRVLTARWLGLEPTGGRLFALDPASPCVLDTEHGAPVVARWNMPNPVDAAHAPATG
jgi:probable phosphoglycerate mutase